MSNLSLLNKLINVDVQKYKIVVNQLSDQIEMLNNCASRAQIFNDINSTLQIIKNIQRLFSLVCASYQFNILIISFQL